MSRAARRTSHAPWTPQPKASKYLAQKTVFDGEVFDSKLEADVARQLSYRMLAGEITKIERQVPYRLEVNEKLICRYVADFRVTLADGTQELVEAKGMATRTWALKEKLFRALFPDIPLKVVKQ